MIKATDSKPWYKQFWPWFVISLPATAVVAGLITVVIAVQNKPDIVRDDWYKDGVAIQVRKERTERAKALGIVFNYSLERETRKFHLTSTGLDSAATPILVVSLQHPTLQKRDIEATAALMPDGRYSALLQAMPEGNYRAQISAPNGDWQVNGDIQFGSPEHPSTTIAGQLSAH